MAEAGVGTVPIKPDFSGMQGAVGREIDKTTKTMSSKFRDFGKNTFRAGAQMSVALSAPIVLGMKKAFDAASDLNENMSKSQAVFGDASGAIDKFAKNAAKNIGLSRSAALDATGTFGNLFVQLGIGSGQAAKMSTEMVTLAADFASFHNADITEVIEAQSAAFRGEYDALQRFVPTINAATVEQKALAMTGKETTKELTAQEKALAVQKIMMSTAGDAMGDFARTSEGAANKQRILKAQFEDSTATIGQKLLPVGIKLLGWLQKAVSWFAKLGQPMQGIILAAVGLLAVIGPLVTVVGALATAIGVLTLPVVAVGVGIAAAVVLASKLAGGFGNLSKMASQLFGILFRGDFKSGPFAEDSKIVDVAFKLRDAIAGIVGVAKQAFNILFRDDFVGGPFHEDSSLMLALFSVRDGIERVGAMARQVFDVLFRGDFKGGPFSEDSEFIDIVFRVRDAIGNMASFFVAKFQEIAKWTAVVWPQVQEAITHVLNVVSGVVRTAVAIMSAVWKAGGDDLLNFTRAVWDFMYRTINNVLTVIKNLIQFVLAVINGDWGQAWTAIKNIFSAVWDQIKNILGLALNAARAVLGAALSLIGTMWRNAWDAVKNYIRDRFNDIVADVTAKLNAIRSLWSTAWNAVKIFLSDRWKEMKSTVSTRLTEVVDFFKKLPGRVVFALGDLGGLLVGKGREIVDGLINGIKKAAKNIAGALSGVLAGAVRSIPGVGGKVADMVFGNVGDAAAAVQGTFIGGNALSTVQKVIGKYPGARITSTYRSPEHNRRVGGSPTSHHMDRNNPAVDIVGPTHVLDAIAAELAKYPHRQLLWRVPNHAPGDNPHVHFAHTGGMVDKSWPTIPGIRADERPAILQTGERVLSRNEVAGSQMSPEEFGRRAADEYARRLQVLTRSA